MQELKDMREEYIREELKNGNTEVVEQIGQLEFNPPSEGEALRMMEVK